MKPPKGITDEPKWIRHCCQIYARAIELREGKISLVEASVALGPLASWTRAESERDFDVLDVNRERGGGVTSESSSFLEAACSEDLYALRRVR
jgi:hypothetical protein